MRVTSERNDADIVIPVVGIPPVDIRAIRIGIADIHEIAVGRKRCLAAFLRCSIYVNGCIRTGTASKNADSACCVKTWRLIKF